jgi:GNAT superfamily N-acetyltransferase
VPSDGVCGKRRAATLADEHLVVQWLTEFTAEAVPDSLPPGADSVRRRLGHTIPGIWLWCVDDQPSSLCWQSILAGGIVRISVVYTPQDHRRHGYASANVAAVTRQAFDEGATACMLYTDKANPTSNSVYESIGYRYVGDAAEIRFTATSR